VLLAVSDTGHGMDASIKARIFEPFFTTKEPGKGTGLGLAMVYGFIKQSSGHIAVYSEPGRGTTFKLYLPHARGVGAVVPSSPGLAGLPRGNETILLVEDEDGVRAFVRHLLQICGYTVLEASHGTEALKIVEEHCGPIHLLITDVVMPQGMGGPQVAAGVASRCPEVSVLFVSGYTDDAVVRHGILEERTNFLQKPFTPTALAQKVREVLDLALTPVGG
jgi:CheY-like chemotaxis protein